VPLTFERHVEGDCLIVAVSGACAEHECSAFIGGVKQGLVPGITKVVLDMSGMGRMSSAVLTELATEHRRLAGAGCQLVLVCADNKVRRMLSLSALDKVIPTVESVARALAGGSRSRESQRILGPDGLVG
jgi:anti-sigma B factor antagonist